NYYDGAIKYVDGQIESLVEALKELEVYDNSLIIFTSDHGQEFLEHGGSGHGFTLYEEQLRVPLIIFPTAVVPAAREVDAPVGLIDLFPTLDDWLSLGFYKADQSVSLKNLILKADETEVRSRRFLFSETDKEDSLRSVLFENKWKYIENVRKDTQELYDLAADPEEQKNVSPLHPALSASLRERLHSHIAELEKNAVASRKLDLDEWTKQSLKAMGYLE
ncbi:MAG: sulfatase-like hydrolase/transferase, partial [Candidatus Hydrogenedentota bacterium]